MHINMMKFTFKREGVKLQQSTEISLLILILVMMTNMTSLLQRNCDDAAGFCLDTMATHHLHKTPGGAGT